jgi:hypothetical protein
MNIGQIIVGQMNVGQIIVGLMIVGQMTQTHRFGPWTS